MKDDTSAGVFIPDIVSFFGESDPDLWQGTWWRAIRILDQYFFLISDIDVLLAALIGSGDRQAAVI